MTLSWWYDKNIQDKVLQVLLAVLLGSVTSKDMQYMIKKPVYKLRRPVSFFSKCVIYELLSSVARCAGYEPLQN